MTHEQRKALIRQIDQAISLGASIEVNVHPQYNEDSEPLTNMMHNIGPVTTRRVSDEDAYGGIGYDTHRVVHAKASVTLYTRTNRPRPSADMSRRFDVA